MDEYEQGEPEEEQHNTDQPDIGIPPDNEKGIPFDWLQKEKDIEKSNRKASTVVRNLTDFNKRVHGKLKTYRFNEVQKQVQKEWGEELMKGMNPPWET